MFLCFKWNKYIVLDAIFYMNFYIRVDLHAFKGTFHIYVKMCDWNNIYKSLKPD